MPSHEGNPPIDRVFPHGRRTGRNRQVSWLPGLCSARPSRLHSGHSGLRSPVTVAGTAPDCHRLPFSPRFPEAPVTRWAD